MKAIYLRISLYGLGAAIVGGQRKPITLPGTVQASSWSGLGA